MKESLLSRGIWVALFVGLISVFPAGLAFGGEAIPNWEAPAFWSPARAAHGVTIQGDITSPLPFIGVTPCRQYDSRNTTPLPQNTAREVVITGAPCSLPSGAAAVSLNVTVFNILGQTGNAVFQVGTTTNPTTAWINYPIGQGQIGNAGVLPLSGAHSIFFRVQQGAGSIDFTIDVNGYYAKTPASSSNSFEVVNSSQWAVIGRTTSSGLGAVGVLGHALATTGNTIGVWGQTESSTAYARGVMGQANNSAGGRTYGVLGLTLSSSDDAAGVYGFDGSGEPLTSQPRFAAGVRGASKFYWGVLGVSRGLAVVGHHLDGAGNTVSAGYLGYDDTTGVFALGEIGATGAKPFIEPHPTDATKEIAYVALEGPEAGTYFRGRGRIHNGTGVITVPESFRLVSDEEGLTVQITPIGQVANVAVVSADLDTITVRSSARDLEFYYVVNGVRKAFKDWEVITENRHYVPERPEAKMPGAFAPEQRRRLIATGIYNEDGTVNLETAERLGWAKAWRERKEQANAAAAASRAAREAKGENK
jgi:hypothetical protein